MVGFVDGPAQGAYLSLRRAPLLLRAVVSRLDGKVDALDQLDDFPSDFEDVHVYRRVGGVAKAHVCVIPRSKSYWILTATYVHMPDVDADDLNLRDTEIWRKWADATGALLEREVDRDAPAPLRSPGATAGDSPPRTGDIDTPAHTRDPAAAPQAPARPGPAGGTTRDAPPEG